MPRKILGASALAIAAVITVVLTGCGSTGSTTGSSSTPTSGATSTSVGGASFNTAACNTTAAPQPNFTNALPKVSGAASTLSAAGSTFAAPAYSVWTAAYASTESTQVAYQSVGSGAGVQQTIANTIDFGDSDVPMTDAELAQVKGKILHIPLLIGAVVPAYKLAGVGSGLKFTGALLGKIYAGEITTWNDPAIAKLNPGVKLPSEPIAVVHRSDGSGTTGIWTDFLTKTSSDWVSKLGGKTVSAGKTVAWPVGIGGKGNEGVAGIVQQTEGALGYVELQYALAQNTTYGQVQNADKSAFVQPCLATLTAASSVAKFPTDLRGDLTNEPGKNSYPITGTTYALVHEDQTSQAKAAALVNFFSWSLTKGQNLLGSVNFSPLGSALQKESMAQLTKITVNGTPVATK
jgi:phosphate transport system substrate-binding protein